MSRHAFTGSSHTESYNRFRSFPFISHDGWGHKIMQTHPTRDLSSSSSASNVPIRSTWHKGAVTLMVLALLAPAGLVWGHPGGGGGGGGGGHSSPGGGGHVSAGGGGHFSGGGHFNAGPRFAAPAPRYSAPRSNWSYANRAPAYGSSPRGTVTARAGIAPRAPIDYGRFAVGRGTPYEHGDFHRNWDGGYWHGHYWPPVYYRPGFAWFLPVLPAYCVTYWWGGVPYYYYNEAYYTWDPNDGGYVATQPPPLEDGAAGDNGAAPAYPDAPPPGDGNYDMTYGSPDANAQNPDSADPNAPGYNGAPAYNGAPGYSGAPSEAGGNLYAYPKNGQSPEQQAQDRRECAQWAGAQSPDSANGNSMDYKRALTACLSGRGYSVD